MGFLVCEKCGGYYKLQEGESPDKFDYCECGGKLEHHEFLQDYLNSEETFEDLKDQNNSQLIKSTKFENLDEKEKLLMEMELLKEVKGENLESNENLKYRIMAEALLIILLGFIGILTISMLIICF